VPDSSVSRWRLAAPSFVWPAGLAENCQRLQTLVDEAALLFFETEACLAYGPHDLPLWLNDLDLGYHVHMPLDLPWQNGPREVVRTVTALAEKVAFVRPNGYVLHPPPEAKDLAAFYQAWIDRGFAGSDLLIENIEGNDLCRLWPELRMTECSVCLDVGHLLLFDQWDLLQQPGFSDRLAMLHLYGDQPGHGHASLACMTANGRELTRTLLSRLPQGATIVLETFSPRELQESLDIFSTWVTNWGFQ